MHKLKLVITWLLLPVFMAACMAGVQLYSARSLLSLSSQQRTAVEIPLNTCTVTGNEEEWEEEWDEEWEDDWEDDWEDEESGEDGLDEEDLPEEPEEDEPLALETGESLLTIPYTGYVHELTLTGGTAGSDRYQIVAVLPDGTRQTWNPLFNASLGEDTTAIHATVTGFEISCPSGGMEIEGITVHNEWVLNPNRMLLTAMLAACLYLLIAFRGAMAKKPDLAFLCIALSLGIYLSVGLPANISLTFDDHVHIDRVLLLSYGPESRVTKAGELLYNLSWSVDEDGLTTHRMDTLRDEQAFIARMDAQCADDGSGQPQRLHWQYSDTGYLAQTLGVVIARAVGLPFHMQLIAARVCNMLLYVLLCFAAVMVMKRGKLLMACVCLAPTALFQACCITYDPTGTALCTLGIALALDAMMDRSIRLTRARGLGILLTLVLGSLTKVVYMPLLLLVLLMPKEKFSSNRQQMLFKAMACVICLAGILSMVMNVTGGTVRLQDDRGTGNTGDQIAFILHNPFRYLAYLASWIWVNLKMYFVTMSRMNWAYVTTAGDMLTWISMGTLVLLIVFDGTAADRRVLRGYQRLGMLIVACMVVGLTFTTMYVAFSAVGSTDFSGVQARYLLPVLPLIWMMFNPSRPGPLLPEKYRTLIYSLLMAAVPAVMCITDVCMRYFL